MAEPDFYLSDEQRELQRVVREFTAKEITPIAAECDAAERFPKHLFPIVGELGYLGLGLPEAIGGYGGSTLDYTVLWEELAYGAPPASRLASMSMLRWPVPSSRASAPKN